jgi:beta-glucanase (GH16 family)
MRVSSAIVCLWLVNAAAGAEFWPQTDPENKAGWIAAAEWTDEFEGSRLDSTKWHHTIPWWPAGTPPFYYNPHNISVAGGALKLTIDAGKVPLAFAKTGYRINTAAVTNIKSIRYGLFETKAKIARCAASSVFWFQHEMIADKPDPNFLTEIDVVENRHVKDFETLWIPTVHTFRAPGLKEPQLQTFPTDAKVDLTDDFHIYAVEWGPDEIVFSMDGRAQHTVKNEHLHQPLTMTINIECWRKWYPLLDKTTLPATFEVDYVRAWTKPGW